MKGLLYLALVLVLVPLHTSLLPHASLWGVTPDLGLVVAAFVGLLAGELEGLLVGLAIGWVLNIYSAGELWISLVTKGGAGLLAGLLGRQVAMVTPTVLSIGLLCLSLLSGIVTAFSIKHADLSDVWSLVQSIALPQACLDAVLGAGLVWLASQRLIVDRLHARDRFS